MAEKLFPARQRCKACSKKLGVNRAPVHLGLYCTPRCAGLAEPVLRAEDAPRECKTQRDGKWEFKRRYRSESEIPEKLRSDRSVSWYWCNNHCGQIHIGHSRIDLSRETHRVLPDRAALSDLLVKSRGHATHKQVAEVIGVRPIRIKEWENPEFDTASFDVLLKLLSVYHLKLAAVFPVTR